MINSWTENLPGGLSVCEKIRHGIVHFEVPIAISEGHLGTVKIYDERGRAIWFHGHDLFGALAPCQSKEDFLAVIRAMKGEEEKQGPCPEPDCDLKTRAWNFDEILNQFKAEVVWEDTFVNGKGETFKRPDQAYWTLLDGDGLIGFQCIQKKDDELAAKAAGAMFLFLYHNTDIDISWATRLAEVWGCTFKKKETPA